MVTRLGLFLLLSLFAPLFAAEPFAESPHEAPRRVVPLNDGWRFAAKDEASASEVNFDDRAWSTIQLPHTWNARDGQDGGRNYRRAPSWYRTHVQLTDAFAGKKLYLEFDGASLSADVFVNGRRLGRHEGGFARFRFDVTEALRIGEDNIIAVRVDNRRQNFPPTGGDFTIFGGLYRRARIVATDRVQLTTMDHASSGVYVVQDKITAEQAALTIRTKVENHDSRAHDVELRVSLRDASGAVVKSASRHLALAAQANTAVAEPLVLAQPHLWNGRADPYLYTVAVEVVREGAVCDVVTQPVGLRFYQVDPARGFLLNGHYLDLHGVCRHQDRINQGWAISDADEAEDFAFIRELGATAIRVAHYQQSQSWYERADRAGLIVWAEIPMIAATPDDPHYAENAKQQMRELVRQNFNHPSICFWSVGNETRGKSSESLVVALTKEARAEDPTRLSTYASDAPEQEAKNWYADVSAFNRYLGWWYDELSDWGPWLDLVHEHHPKSSFAISEFGVGANLATHQEDPPKPNPRGKFHPEEYQTKFHEAAWGAMRTRPFVWGKFIWNLFDFAADHRDDGDSLGLNDRGLVTYDRKTRKDAFYFYKANWSDEPVLYLTSRRFTARSTAGVEIKVYANAPEVSLTLNGKSLGAKRSDNHVFVWPAVKFAPGANRVEASAVRNGVTLTDRCEWQGVASTDTPAAK